MRVLNYSKNDFLRFGLLLTGVNTIISLLFLRLFLGSDFDDKVLEIFNSIFSNNRLPTLPKVNEMLVTELDEVLGPKSEETLVTKADEVLKLKSNEALLATSTIPQKSIFWFIYHKEFYFCVIGAVISLYAVKSLQSEEGFFEGISTLVSSSQEIINSSIGKIHSLFHRAPVRTLPFDSPPLTVKTPVPFTQNGPFAVTLIVFPLVEVTKKWRIIDTEHHTHRRMKFP